MYAYVGLARKCSVLSFWLLSFPASFFFLIYVVSDWCHYQGRHDRHYKYCKKFNNPSVKNTSMTNIIQKNNTTNAKSVSTLSVPEWSPTPISVSIGSKLVPVPYKCLIRFVFEILAANSTQWRSRPDYIILSGSRRLETGKWGLESCNIYTGYGMCGIVWYLLRYLLKNGSGRGGSRRGFFLMRIGEPYSICRKPQETQQISIER